MKNKHVTEYLDYYIKLENPQYAVLLKGNWGCGKTYYVKNLKKSWHEPEDGEQIKLQPIYISLNGIESVKTINDKLRAEINPFLYSKGMQVARKIFKGLLKSTAKIDLNFDDDEKSEGNVSLNIDSLGIFDKKSDDIKGKRILIFDDIERCKIATDELFGYINNFVEHSACKVILVSDEEKIKRKYESDKDKSGISYKDFKEKLIGQTFEIESDIEMAITHFIEDTQKLKSNQELLNHKLLVQEIFIASQLDNLRVLKQALFDFNRFTSFFETELSEEANYKEFIKNILTYFIIVYAEHKTGNDKIHKFQAFHIYNDQNQEESKIENKYIAILDKYKISHSSYSITIQSIIRYIENGFIDVNKLNKELKSNTFFRRDVEQDWEKLWWWNFIDDKEFKPLFNKVWHQFTKEDISNVAVLIHIAGILVTLVDEHMINKRKDYILKRAKKIIDKILSTQYIDIEAFTYGPIDGALGKQYQSFDSPEIKELFKYFIDNGKRQQVQKASDYLNEVFYNLADDNITSLHNLLITPLPDKSTTYEYSAIFKSINGKKLGKRIKQFGSKGVFEFKRFLHKRYFPEERYSNVELESYHKDDLNCLIDLYSELGSNLKKYEKIKNRMINELISELDKIIEKLKSI
jgi:hypothetical protein